jgi:ABC-type polysaccharide/polyol phosphate transport system ATPase subunit
MAVVKFDHVTKTYRLGTRGGLRETLMNGLAKLAKGDKSDKKLFSALDDVSFEVDKGEVLGIIGRNGAGKTTALKLLSRVTYPTSGHISVKGRISALIELGAGFHPDLSGAENIYLNASILGLKQAEIAAKFDEIVAFSGLEKFIDTPIKRYSSGMYARLAFSVAAHVDPDVLLVDEVLSVGDAVFQEKSLNKMKKFKEEGKTMVFISHSMVAVQSICTRVMWLDRGKIKEYGEPSEVISKYLRDQHYEQKNILDLEEGEELFYYDEGDLTIEDIKVLDQKGQPFETIAGGAGVTVEIHYRTERPISMPRFKLYLTLQQHRLTGTDFGGMNGNGRPLTLDGTGVISCTFESSPTRPGPYDFNLDILEENRLIYRKKGIGPLIVRPDQSASRWEEYNLFNLNCHWETKN